MPATYDHEDQVLELKQELATAEDNLKAEFAAHGKTLERMHATEERMARIEAKMKAFAEDMDSDPWPLPNLAAEIRAMLADDTANKGIDRKDGEQ
jgi:hypothetical protein